VAVTGAVLQVAGATGLLWAAEAAWAAAKKNVDMQQSAVAAANSTLAAAVDTSSAQQAQQAAQAAEDQLKVGGLQGTAAGGGLRGMRAIGGEEHFPNVWGASPAGVAAGHCLFSIVRTLAAAQ
jgi:hypothetical protein